MQKCPIQPSNLHPIDAFHLAPGDCISGDQLKSTHPGIIPTYKGSPSTSFYHAGSLLVDHASRFLHFTPHQSTGATEAISAKQTLELLVLTFNCSIKHYHADNGIFTSNPFRQSYDQQKQCLTFCGVDAHHQNGITQCHTRTITERALTMLIHAMLCWLDITTESYWLFAIQLAVDLNNSTPGDSKLTPLEIFSGTKGNSTLSNIHHFGCPIFVLDPSLHQNNKIPTWKPIPRVGVYLGYSPHHASTIPLVYSPTIELVSPQYHVIFDDKFTTVNCLHTNNIPTHWPYLFNTSAISHVDNDFTKTSFYQSSTFNDPSSSLPRREQPCDIPDTSPPNQDTFCSPH